jgi:hypothetical protein
MQINSDLIIYNFWQFYNSYKNIWRKQKSSIFHEVLTSENSGNYTIYILDAAHGFSSINAYTITHIPIKMSLCKHNIEHLSEFMQFK